MSFDLPGGASFDEDGGDPVIKADDGGVILRWDETNSEWSTTAVSTDDLDSAIENGSDVSGSRSFDTTFQNTSGQNLLVAIRLSTAGGTNDKNHNYDLFVQNESASIVSDSNRVDMVFIDDDVLTGNATLVVTCEVPNGGHYHLRNGTGNEATISSWIERGRTA